MIIFFYVTIISQLSKHHQHTVEPLPAPRHQRWQHTKVLRVLRDSMGQAVRQRGQGEPAEVPAWAGDADGGGVREDEPARLRGDGEPGILDAGHPAADPGRCGSYQQESRMMLYVDPETFNGPPILQSAHVCIFTH